MEKLFEKIGDHFNNPEMSDRILVVKIRTDGWEKLEAARRVKNMTKTSSDNNEDSSSPTNNKSGGNTNVRLEEKQPVTSDKGSDVPSSSVEEGNTFGNVDSSRTVSSLSCDSGIGCETLPSEAKRTVKSKKREDSLTVVENRESVARDNLDAEKTSDSNDASTSSTVSSPELDLDIAYTKLLLTDIGYANKAGAIGLTGASNSSLTSGENEVNKTAADNGVLKAREEDLVLADTVIREHQLCVHSFWLALNSSYFRSLFFSSGMKETKVKKVEMNISESLSAMFLLLIESLYKPEVVMTESVENLLILMRLAHVYDAESTLKTCQKLLGSAELTVEICDKSLNMQEHERLPEMAEFIRRCEEFLVEEFSPLDSQWSNEDFLSLSANGLQKVLSSNDLCVSSENTVFLALMKWAEVNEVFDEQLEPLLELVRFKSMTINYLHDVVTSDHPIASTVARFPLLFEEAVFYHAFSKERQCEEGEPIARKAYDEPVVFNWTVDIGEDIEVEKKKKIIKSPHFWVSGYEMFLELKLRTSGCQGLYLTISTRDFRHNSKGFVKLAYSLTSNFPKATRVINEADVFDREGSGWGYEEFFPLSWSEFKDQLKRTPLIITSQVSLLE
ncbi:unnamed protein product [Porites lobata]|uniref:BTB domain-containing protein n=1 Tax=Porites lobata TaxID=104759 RepID=A0ABN8NZA2_9CNID|nr:unnamed protein product [Porites lobata]